KNRTGVVVFRNASVLHFAASREKNVTALGATALVESNGTSARIHRSRMAAGSIGVTGLVLSKRSMHDELKKPSEYLICLDDCLGLAAHAVRAAAVGSASARTLPAGLGAI